MINPFQTTLIIGLGGVGSRIVEDIYKKFEAAGPSEQDRRNVAFVCLDTDEADIAKRRAAMKTGVVVKTSSDKSATVGDYIESIQNRSTVNQWFDTRSRQVVDMKLNKGAGQIRMASRLAYISAIQEGKLESIGNTISKLLAVDPERHPGNDIKIHIISSLAGGTGAGTFLQVAYYVKKAMRDRNSDAPEITGYFLLANVLCNDASMGFSKDQKENCRSNTYACIKEQVAFSSSDRDASIHPISFEYMLGQRDTSLPNAVPYDSCYMVDYTGAAGSNLQLERRYEQQVGDFVYLNAFSPIGDKHRSDAINDIRQQVEHDGTRRYAGIGVSRLVYPVDDLFAYFAREQVVSSLNETWLRIDRNFAALMAECKKKIAEGIPVDEPDRGRHYMDNVEDLAKNGTGRVGMEFLRIYRSTQILDKDLTSIGSKAISYVNAINEHVANLVESNKSLMTAYEESSAPLNNFVENDDDTSNRNDIRMREEQLDNYWKKTKAFIESISRSAVAGCLSDDKDEKGYVSADVHRTKHRLNSYILEKDHEMHPVAVRYFLYDVRAQLQMRLATLTDDNKDLKENIDSYKTRFDDKETPDIVETAEDLLNHRSGIKGLVDRIKHRPKEEKERYVNQSRIQCNNIHEYSVNSLLEATFNGLLVQVGQLIDESEQFFARLPYTIENLKNESLGLLTKHDAGGDPATQYVLASRELKEDIYESVVSVGSSPMISEEMSAALYRGMFANLIASIETQGPATNREPDAKAELERRIQADRSVIGGCVDKQDEMLRAQFSQYANMNVIEALKEEAQRETHSTDMTTQVFPYMKRKFNAFRDRAQIWGPDNLGDDVRYINAWGLNPVCNYAETGQMVGDRALTVEQALDLFGDTHVGTNSTNAATRLASDFFAPNEIVRANAVTLLSISNNFRDFVMREKNDNVSERIGEYYQAYTDVINRMKKPGSMTYSPHLDKHWHLPSYMPAIGKSMTDELKRFFEALCWGVLMGKYNSIEESGEYYWKYKGVTARWITDEDGRRVAVGKSQNGAFNNLIEKGLANNPEIVDEVLAAADTLWHDARLRWHDTGHDTDNELQLMKQNVVVEKILTVRMDDYSFTADSGANWFSLLSANRGTLLYKMLNDGGIGFKDSFFDDLVKRLLGVFGPGANTRSLCAFLFDTIADASVKDDALAALRRADEEGMFSL